MKQVFINCKTSRNVRFTGVMYKLMAKTCDVQNSWMILRKKELILLRIVGNYISELLIKGYLLWFGNQFFEVASKDVYKMRKRQLWKAIKSVSLAGFSRSLEL